MPNSKLKKPDIPEHRRIRVMLVEDSPTELYLLQKMFSLAPDIEVVASARNGREALDLLPSVQPDVVCTDYHMPVMDGLEFIIRAMKQHPCAILVLSAWVQPTQKDNIFRLLSAGALDVLAKPLGTTDGITQNDAQLLLEAIRGVARSPSLLEKLTKPALAPLTTMIPHVPTRRQRVELVALGASTGGPQILQRILSQLPSDFAAPVVCVQHISEGFLEGMISWMQSSCAIRLEIAQAGRTPRPGHVYFAPDAQHLSLNIYGRFVLSDRFSPDLHCPSIDHLFTSVANTCGTSAMGVLLSGMGRDGAKGLRAMFDADATTIAQDEATSIIFGMPAAAIQLDAAKYILPTDKIAAMMIRLVG